MKNQDNAEDARAPEAMKLVEVRCTECRRLLCKSAGGIVEVKCPRCRAMTTHGK